MPVGQALLDGCRQSPQRQEAASARGYDPLCRAFRGATRCRRDAPRMIRRARRPGQHPRNFFERKLQRNAVALLWACPEDERTQVAFCGPHLDPAHHVQIFLEDNLPAQKTAMAAWDSMTPPGAPADGSSPRQHRCQPSGLGSAIRNDYLAVGFSGTPDKAENATGRNGRSGSRQH